MTTTAQISKGMERGILGLFTTAAAVIGLSLAAPAVRQVITIAGGEVPMSMLTSAEVPVSTSDGGAGLASATFQSAWVVATGLSGTARTLLAAGVVTSAITTLLTTGAIVMFLLLLLWRRPFHRALIVATQVAGSALLIGSVLSVGLGGLGRMMAADELNPVADDVFMVGFAFDPTFVLAGIGVLSLSLVFSYGAKLQRDTEGLV